jgi:hypothetical protein
MYLAYTCEPERILGTLGGPAAAGLMPSDEEKETSPCIDKVVTSLQKSMKKLSFP